jgi:translation initiation factor IF-3
MIRVSQVRVVDSEGEQLGIMPVADALEVASNSGLDLVEVAPNAAPPVCRIMDYGKFKYDASKKARDAKKRQSVVIVKEIKFKTRTDNHDFDFKVRNIKRFLKDGHKVKVTIMFRGREITHTEIGTAIIARVEAEVKDEAVIESRPRLEGRNMTMLLAPPATPQK